MSDSTPSAQATSSTPEMPLETAPQAAENTSKSATDMPTSAAKNTAVPEEVVLPELTPQQLDKLLSGIKRKVKVDGEEIEVGIQDMEKDYRMRRASDKRMQEAAELRKKVEHLISTVRTNPRKALSDPMLGLDLDKLAEEIIMERIEEETLDPKDREIRQLKKERDDKLATEKAAKEKEESDKAAQLEAQYTEQYQRDIQKALKDHGLPITNSTVRSMVNYLSNALDNKLDLAPSDVVDLVKEDYQNQLKELFSAADGSIIAQLLGDEGVKKIREYDNGRIKQLAPTPKIEEQAAPKAKVEPKKKSLEQVLRDARERAGVKD